MLTIALQHINLIWSNYLKHIQPHPNPRMGKPRLRVKSKMTAIKPVIYIYILYRYYFRTKHRRATYNMYFRTNFFCVFYFFTS